MQTRLAPYTWRQHRGDAAEVNRGVLTVGCMRMPRLWVWIIIAVRHYHCDVITVIMWRTLAPVPLLAAPLSREAGASPTSLAQCSLHTLLPGDHKLAQNLYPICGRSNTIHHLACSAKEAMMHTTTRTKLAAHRGYVKWRGTLSTSVEFLLAAVRRRKRDTLE